MPGRPGSRTRLGEVVYEEGRKKASALAHRALPTQPGSKHLRARISGAFSEVLQRASNRRTLPAVGGHAGPRLRHVLGSGEGLEESVDVGEQQRLADELVDPG